MIEDGTSEVEALIKHRDDSELIKPQPLVSAMLFIKLISSSPFYLIGIYAPEYLDDYSWILYNESFHHYHSRIFYLLALYRCISQLYFAVWGNGLVQRRFVMLECAFDISVILLYIHEYVRLHNIKTLFCNYTILHMCYVIMSLICLAKTESTKLIHPV